MRPLALLAALLLAAPGTAQDKPYWVGGWEGKVGPYSVRLCMDVWGDDLPGRGSYYYLSQRKPIALTEEDGEGGWIERSGDSEARWEFGEQNGERLRGNWRQGSRTLPFELEPRRWSENDWGAPCSSPEFVEPLLASGQVAEQPAELEGWSYIARTYRSPAQLADVVDITSFTFAPEQPGDAAINAALADDIPRGTVGDDLYECMAGAISSLGVYGYFERFVQPSLVSRHFLGVDDANSNFCGGAHPNHWQVMHTYDRWSGEEIDLFGWLGEDRIDGEDSVIAGELRALILGRWPADAEADCRELAAEAEYWSIGLARDSLVFQPDLPHVATACEERVTVEWDALAPFLDEDGKAGLARLRGG